MIYIFGSYLQCWINNVKIKPSLYVKWKAHFSTWLHVKESELLIANYYECSNLPKSHGWTVWFGKIMLNLLQIENLQSEIEHVNVPLKAMIELLVIYEWLKE